MSHRRDDDRQGRGGGGRFSRRWVLLAAGPFLAACANGVPGERFGGTGTGAGAAGNAQPNSPTYFVETIGDRVFFATDQSTLSPEAMATLDGQARWLMENPEYDAVIEGHTDERGTREYNLALGARRAAAVRDYLVAQGVAARRLKTVSYGKERPVALCSAERCWAQNRRAVTVLTPAGA